MKFTLRWAISLSPLFQEISVLVRLDLFLYNTNLGILENTKNTGWFST